MYVEREMATARARYTFGGTYGSEGSEHVPFREWVTITAVWADGEGVPVRASEADALAACGITRAELDREWIESIRDAMCSADEQRTERAMEGR